METILENLINILDYRVKTHGHMEGYRHRITRSLTQVKRLSMHASMWCLILKPTSMTDLPT